MNPNDQTDQSANPAGWQPPTSSPETVQQPAAPGPVQPSQPPAPAATPLPEQPQPMQQPIAPNPIQKDQTGAYTVVPPLQNQGPTGHNPYEFIMASNAPGPSKSMQRLSLTKKIIFAVVTIAAVISLIALGKKLFVRPDPTITGMVAIAQEQKEVIRIASKHRVARDENVKAFAANVQNIVGTDYMEVTSYLKKRKALPKPEVLVLKQDGQTDKILKDASATNTYDDTFLKTLYAQLTDYETNLANTYKSVDGKNAKAVLEKSYANAQLLKAQPGITDPAQPAQ